MEDYDVGRLPSFDRPVRKLSTEELVDLIRLEPRLSASEVREIARPDVDVEQILRNCRKA